MNTKNSVKSNGNDTVMDILNATKVSETNLNDTTEVMK